MNQSEMNQRVPRGDKELLSYSSVPDPTRTPFLSFYRLAKNPFVDRTAEKTRLDPTSVYLPSDLQGFSATDMTYVIFGRRGSGKTTIRRYMEAAYTRHNQRCFAAPGAGAARPFLIADLCKPGHLTNCLAAYQKAIQATDDNWEVQFQSNWTSSDFVDCIMVYVATELAQQLYSSPGRHGGRKGMILDALEGNPKAAAQLLLLIHLYARIDSNHLHSIRQAVMAKNPQR
ncbi:hypothetical protein CYMTET_36579, partial [Cymbomonas tetramitiformis]